MRKGQRQPRGRKPRAGSVPRAVLADAVADTAIMPSEPAAANSAPYVRTLRLWASGFADSGTDSSVCGTTIQGNLQVDGNAARV